MSWNPNSPSGGPHIRLQDDKIRENWVYLAAQLAVAFDFSDTGHVLVQKGTKADRDAVATPPDGMPFIRTDIAPGALDVYRDGAWERTVGPRVGDMMPWSGDPADLATDKPGWALCDGDTENLFVTPDLQSQFLPSYSSSDADFGFESAAGIRKHPLTIAEMPEHDHGGGAHDHDYDFPDISSAGIDTSSPNYGPRTEQTATAGIILDVDGGDVGASEGDDGVAHENRPAYYTLAMIVFVDVP